MALNDYTGQPLSMSNPLVKRLVAVTYPKYRPRKISARLWTGPRQLENFWSEGSRSWYVAVRIADGAVSNFGTDNPFMRQSHEPVDLPAGVLLVERTIFCGKDAGITVWGREDTLGEGPAIAGLLGS